MQGGEQQRSKGEQVHEISNSPNVDSNSVLDSNVVAGGGDKGEGEAGGGGRGGGGEGCMKIPVLESPGGHGGEGRFTQRPRPTSG